MNTITKELFEEIDKQIALYHKESSEIHDRYYDRKRYRYKSGFLASEWTYYTEFVGKANYREWEDTSICSYLNFLSSKVLNLKNKKNQIFWKYLGK